MKIALTIAGSDSGGGAGIQADLRTFAALRVFGTSVVTALTAQNTRTVTNVFVTPPDMVAAQLAAVLDDLPPAAMKTGMLADAATVETVAEILAARGKGIPLVVDPVMISKSGAALLASDAVKSVIARLLPLAAIVTPNLPEAEALCGRPVDSPERVREAAKAIAGLGARAVLVKGGHATGDVVEDVLWDGTDFTVLSGPRLATTSTHGTGCTLSAAIVAWLARGATPVDAVRRARRFLEGALAAARPLGGGHGPTHHMFPFYPWSEPEESP